MVPRMARYRTMSPQSNYQYDRQPPYAIGEMVAGVDFIRYWCGPGVMCSLCGFRASWVVHLKDETWVEHSGMTLGGKWDTTFHRVA